MDRICPQRMEVTLADVKDAWAKIKALNAFRAAPLGFEVSDVPPATRS